MRQFNQGRMDKDKFDTLKGILNIAHKDANVADLAKITGWSKATVRRAQEAESHQDYVRLTQSMNSKYRKNATPTPTKLPLQDGSLEGKIDTLAELMQSLIHRLDLLLSPEQTDKDQ